MSRRKQARPIRHLESDADVDDRLTSVATAVVTDEEPVAESSASEEEEVTHPDDLLDEQNNNTSPDEAETPRAAPAAFPFPLPGHHVTLEALQNTKVAVAQFAATAMAGNADNAAALQELAVLQSTLFTLQHQQVMQLSLIQQLQQQLQITRCPKDTASPPPQPADSESPQPPPPPPTTQSLPASPPAAAVAKQQLKPPSPPPPLPPPPPPPPPPQQQQQQLPLCSISSSLASSIITNTDPPPLNEPNTLEMLQRRAQEVLDNASQGLLANNLADELAFRKGGKSSSLSPYDGKTGGRNEPFFKHRCRYCGKVFGSDSALQIHIRSHTDSESNGRSRFPFHPLAPPHRDKLPYTFLDSNINMRPGNTTCNICFKTFACNSALEIHYRSHTKERPFKCTVCDRGFSTKGNMKQHMLTHKIRDMPAHLFETNKPTMPPPVPGINVPNEDSTSTEDRSMPTPTSLEPAPKPDLGVKRSPPEGETVLPIPKRQPGLPKHLCHVCNKNFSSSSALQIHMRTHTGDKPFRCTICQKAFTTKGNLKVHMGTHMWSNGASRRGRRMSLDLPPIPMTPKDSEFLQRRPDLFYPYLPTPFLNGMQQKLNEISVIQSVNSNSGLSPPGGKYASLLGFGGYPTDKPLLPDPTRSQPGSPLSDKQPSSVSPPPPLSMSSHHGSPPRLGGDISLSERSMWDIHYERKPSMGNGDEPMDVSPSPPSHVNPHQQTAPRGEGLAA